MIRIVSQGIALVTGATSGIGAVYAHRLALRGYDLVLVAPDSGRLAELAEWLRRDTGQKIETLAADLTTASGVDAVEDRLILDGRMTMLVNNTSAAAAPSPTLYGFESIGDLIGHNVGVPARLAYAAAGGFAERGRGTIITIAPSAAPAHAAMPGTEDGGRALLLELTRILSEELSSRGVRAQLVLPNDAASALWDLAAAPLDGMGEELLFLVQAMIDHVLVTLDRNVAVARPSLPRITDWDLFAQHAARAPFARFARATLVELA